VPAADVRQSANNADDDAYGAAAKVHIARQRAITPPRGEKPHFIRFVERVVRLFVALGSDPVSPKLHRLSFSGPLENRE
jgi:hypothetical protein